MWRRETRETGKRGKIIDTNKRLRYDTNLTKYCQMPTEDILAMDFFPNAKIERTDRYTYFDNNSPILAIAHADTVQDITWTRTVKASEIKIDATKLVGLTRKQRKALKKQLRAEAQAKADAEGKAIPAVELAKCKYYGKTDSDLIAECIALDDRLGIWIICDVLPKLGIVCDVLITTDEEIAQTSAMDFVTKKQYNWMFQFDRHGFGNVVMYEYSNPESELQLESLGYEVERGTYSDICALSDLGCIGFNFGCGYKNEHTKYCMSRESWVDTCVRMFESFYDMYKDTEMPYSKPAFSESKWRGAWGNTATGGGYNGYYGNWEDGYLGENEGGTAEAGKYNTAWWKNEVAKDEQKTLAKPNLCQWCDNPLITDEEQEMESCIDCVIESKLCGVCSVPDSDINPVFKDDKYGWICASCDASKWDSKMGHMANL